jgi:hypothetical protein
MQMKYVAKLQINTKMEVFPAYFNRERPHRRHFIITTLRNAYFRYVWRERIALQQNVLNGRPRLGFLSANKFPRKPMSCLCDKLNVRLVLRRQLLPLYNFGD